MKGYWNKSFRNILTSNLIEHCINGDEYKALDLMKFYYINYIFRDQNGNSILMIALKNNMSTLANKLLQSDDIYINEEDNKGMTALSIACYNKQESIALSILEFPGTSYH